MLMIDSKKKIEISVRDSQDLERIFYSGEDETHAEEIESCLEMVVDIADIFPNATVATVQDIWEILEESGHTP